MIPRKQGTNYFLNEPNVQYLRSIEGKSGSNATLIYCGFVRCAKEIWVVGKAILHKVGTDFYLVKKMNEAWSSLFHFAVQIWESIEGLGINAE